MRFVYRDMEAEFCASVALSYADNGLMASYNPGLVRLQEILLLTNELISEGNPTFLVSNHFQHDLKVD